MINDNQNLFPSVKSIIDYILNPYGGTVFFTLEYDDDGNVIKAAQSIDLCAVKEFDAL